MNVFCPLHGNIIGKTDTTHPWNTNRFKCIECFKATSAQVAWDFTWTPYGCQVSSEGISYLTYVHDCSDLFGNKPANALDGETVRNMVKKIFYLAGGSEITWEDFEIETSRIDENEFFIRCNTLYNCNLRRNDRSTRVMLLYGNKTRICKILLECTPKFGKNGLLGVLAEFFPNNKIEFKFEEE